MSFYNTAYRLRVLTLHISIHTHIQLKIKLCALKFIFAAVCRNIVHMCVCVTCVCLPLCMRRCVSHFAAPFLSISLHPLSLFFTYSNTFYFAINPIAFMLLVLHASFSFTFAFIITIFFQWHFIAETVRQRILTNLLDY